MPLFNRLDEFFASTPVGEVPLMSDCQDLSACGAEGLTQFVDGAFVVSLSHDAYVALETENDPRARFSMCHEFGHVRLHKLELMKLASMPHHQAALMRTAIHHPVYADSEWQANAFAGALLVPAEALAVLLNASTMGQLHASYVADRFQVSHECAKRRIQIFYERRSELV